VLFRSLFTFGAQDFGCAHALCFQNNSALLALCLHLAGHGIADVGWRADVLDLDTGDFHPPRPGRMIDHAQQAGVDFVALGQRLVEVHRAHHGAQVGRRQLHDGEVYIAYFIGRLGSVEHLKEHYGVNTNHRVVASDDFLARNVEHLFHHVDLAPNPFKHRHNDGQTGLRSLGVAAKAFDGVVEPLSHHLHAGKDEDDRKENEKQSNIAHDSSPSAGPHQVLIVGTSLPVSKPNRTAAMTISNILHPAPVSLLYVPGHKDRALAKAQQLPADMLIIDLEDAVPADLKAEGRQGAAAAIREGFAGKYIALRINGPGSAHHAADLALLQAVRPDVIVLPKVDHAAVLDGLATPADIPLFAMVESPTGIFNAQAIAAHPRVTGLIAGLNDLAHDLGLPDYRDRSAMALSIQMIVLAARAAGVLAYDGVYNAIDDAAGFAIEAAEGHRLGFDGKTLIHPSQVEPCNRAFAPSSEALADATAIVAAFTGGAERFEGRMIEDMHVDSARQLLARETLRDERRRGIAQA